MERALRQLVSRAYGSGFACPYSRITGFPRSGIFSSFLCNVKIAQVKEKSVDRNQRIFGGGGWIRTTVGIASRFTVCPLWPLGNTPVFTCAPRKGWSWWTDLNPRPADYKAGSGGPISSFETCLGLLSHLAGPVPAPFAHGVHRLLFRRGSAGGSEARAGTGGRNSKLLRKCRVFANRMIAHITPEFRLKLRSVRQIELIAAYEYLIGNVL